MASLDRHETYLNPSTCQDEYVQYDRGGKTPSQRLFLTTKPYGPWEIRGVNDIQHFVRILVALTLKANLVVAEAICKGGQEVKEADKNLRHNPNPSNWKSASKVETIANILTESLSV